MNIPTLELPELSDLSIDQKLAQMLLVGFRGMELDSDNPIYHDIVKHEVGGIILFDYDVLKKSHDRNIASPGQLRSLMQQFYQILRVPTFLSIDQEGGTVNRLKPENGFPETLSHKSLGQLDNLDATREQGKHIAGLLKAYGLNLNFAPCVDLGINKENKAIYGRDRTFSDQPDRVTNHARAYIEGHQEIGVMTALKHFPGHGSSLADTHLGMADVTETWSPEEMIPYERLIAEGLCDMVMTTHIFNGQLDPNVPATLSASIMQGILRESMKYDGVIISDDLQMQAITDYFGLDNVIELALQAGVDILAFGNNLAYEPDVVSRSIHTMKNLLDKGVIDELRINASVKRILKLKKKYLA
ncbi:MAG: glycoside hydrolase family 3 protein [Bacteroidetes bacterium]|nr:glycoside hydrolase family 3 protein [Bacteroidota bacterium]MCH8525313.1 glycoside hydrolase family 3 protein [Balneolales bacterium]